MPNGSFTEGEEKLLLLLMLGGDATISRAQAAEVGARLGRSGDVVRYELNSRALPCEGMVNVSARLIYILPSSLPCSSFFFRNHLSSASIP